MISRIAAILFLVPFLAALFSAAYAQTAEPSKVALVIGNGAYAAANPLKNPGKDAVAVASALTDAGFSVTLAGDLGYSDMVRELGNFQRLASRADSAIIYYAGHGMEINRQNYLIPVDAQLEFVSDADFQTVPLQLFQRAVSDAKVLGLVIVDACRNNPFATRLSQADQSRSVGNGLARVEPGGRTLVALAAREGTFAFDGQGDNSPYALALVKGLRTPGLEIGRLFRQLHDDVVAATNGAQEPVLFGTLTSEDYYFLPPAPVAEVAAEEAASLEAAAVAAAKLQVELAFWQSADAGGRAEDYALYLEVYPDGQFAPLARAKQARLAEAAPQAAPTPSDAVEAPAPAADPPAAQPETAPPKAPALAELLPAPDLPSGVLDPPSLATPGAEPAAIQQLALADTAPPLLPRSEAAPDNAVAAPSPIDLAPETDLTGRDLVVALQTALARANCDPGPVDGIWGGGSLRALRAFAAARPDLISADAPPDAALLRSLLRAEGPVCPTDCPAGQSLFDGLCVALASCPQGQEPNSKGVCHDPSPPRVAPAPKSGGSGCRKFNGREIC